MLSSVPLRFEFGEAISVDLAYWICVFAQNRRTGAGGRLCCKSRKLQRHEFFAKTRSGRRSLIRIPSIALPKSPVSLTRGRQSPHIFTRKTRLQPAEFLITCAKRLLQQYRHLSDTAGVDFPPVPVLLIASTVAFLANSDARAHTAPHKHRFQHHPVTKMVHRKRDSIEARRPNAPAIPPPIARPALADLPPAFAAVKQADELIGRGKVVEATVIEKSIVDPTAQKLLEWALLRRGGSELGFQRYDAFIRANPVWPSIPLLRRRAEAALWRERADAATVRSFSGGQPASPIGKLVLARELMGPGDRVAASAKSA